MDEPRPAPELSPLTVATAVPRVQRIYEPQRVIHVGSLQSADRQFAASDQEGTALSVSEHPDAWQKITPLPGEQWRGAKDTGETGRFLDRLALSADEQDQIMHWALSQGLIEHCQAWQYFYFDDELDDEVALTFDTREAALYESGDDPHSVRLIEAFRGTDQLATIAPHAAGLIGAEHSLLDGYVMLAYAQAAGLDGVWWHERLDPAAYSAPRGAIVHERLGAWSFTNQGGETRRAKVDIPDAPELIL